MQTPSTYLKLAALFALTASAALAQTSGPTSTVVYAGGNDLVLKASDGKLLNYTVPPTYKFSAGGKQVTLSDLKPGTRLTAPVSTGFDPKIVGGVSVTKGKVFGVTPPDGLVLALTEGTKEVVVPTGTTFLVDGKKLALTDLKPGMMVEATIVTAGADTSATDAPPQSGALLVANVAAPADDLPAAGTHLPLFAALGTGLLAMGCALLAFRKPAQTL